MFVLFPDGLTRKNFSLLTSFLLPPFRVLILEIRKVGQVVLYTFKGTVKGLTRQLR